MKNMKFTLTVLMAFVVCMAAFSPALGALPGNHEDYLKNESYKNAFDQFTLGMEEAKDRLAPDEYEVLKKEGDELIAFWIKADMEDSGYSEADAYETAYWMRYEQIGRELRHDWLRKNAEDAQGFYRLKSATFDGYLTLEKGDEDYLYAVEIEAAMRSGSQNSGHFKGSGKLSGSKMIVSHYDGENVAEIIFDGETAMVAASQILMDSGWFGAGVTIDGEYIREKR